VDSPTVTRACPSCGTATPADAAAAVRSGRPAETLDWPQLQDSWRGFFRRENPFFSYFRCGNCGLLYAPRYFSGAALDALYREMPDNTAEVQTDALRRTQRAYWDALRDMALPNGDYVELGCDIGFLTEHAARVTSFSHLWLVEPNEAVHGELASRTHGRPHTLLRDTRELARVPAGGVALATMVHVLDHLLDPGATLDALARVVGEGGWLMVVVHDESSLLARAVGTRWPPYCLQHPQLFRPASLAGLLARHGWESVRTIKTANYFPLPYLARHALFAAGLGDHRVPGSMNWVLPLKLGNVLMLARRTGARA
jgi:hypothetical protein